MNDRPLCTNDQQNVHAGTNAFKVLPPCLIFIVSFLHDCLLGCRRSSTFQFATSVLSTTMSNLSTHMNVNIELDVYTTCIKVISTLSANTESEFQILLLDQESPS